jgi:hypothetical protein
VVEHVTLLRLLLRGKRLTGEYTRRGPALHLRSSSSLVIINGEGGAYEQV